MGRKSTKREMAAGSAAGTSVGKRRVGDTEDGEISDGGASRASVDVAEMCWPVLLTVKRGGHALCLCPQWEEPGHTSLTSKAHVRPKGWNITTIEKNHSAKAPGAPGKGPQAGDKRKQ